MVRFIGGIEMTLDNAVIGQEYIIEGVDTDDEEMNSFLFTLGCYSGEPVTVVAKRNAGLVIAIKDGRYNIDPNLAKLIIVKD